MPTDSLYTLYPEISPYHATWIERPHGHKIYVELSGNPHGKPIIFLHGGPGGGTNPKQRQFFDPKHYQIILFDQRGCGQSKPLGENSPEAIGDYLAGPNHVLPTSGSARFASGLSVYDFYKKTSVIK